MPRHRLVSLLVALVLLGMAVAGCLGGGEDDGTNGNDGGDGNGDGDGDGGSGSGGGSERGSISGSVSAPDGAVGGASVSLSRVFQTTETDAQGRFTFENVSPGDYRLTITNSPDYQRATEDVNMGDGEDVTVDVEMEFQMLPGSDVPRKYGKMVNYVSVLNPLDPDVLLMSASLPLPGFPETTVTNMTKENTFPGFWDLEPEPDYHFVNFDVLLMRFDADALLPEDVPELPEEPPRAQLGLRYFRGESLTENELIDQGSLEYHMPEPLIEHDLDLIYLWVFKIENEDWDQWGSRNWQIGVIANETDDLPLGAGVPHLIQINALLVDEEYAESIA